MAARTAKRNSSQAGHDEPSVRPSSMPLMPTSPPSTMPLSAATASFYPGPTGALTGTGAGNGTRTGNGAGTGAEADPLPPRKRKRRVVSCAECHRRKQKCDRGLPCKGCVDRKMEARCYYETPAMSRERHHLRVAEAVAYGRALQEGSSLPVQAAGFGYAQTDASTNTLGFLHTIGGNTAAAAAAAAAATTTTTTTADAARLAGQQPYYYHNAQHHSDYPDVDDAQGRAPLLPHQHVPALLPPAPASGSSDPFGLADRYRALLRELPPPAAVDALGARYFRDVAWHYATVDANYFYRQLASWRGFSAAAGPFGSLPAPHQLPPDLRAFPALLFQVLATALLLTGGCDDDDGGNGGDGGDAKAANGASSGEGGDTHTADNPASFAALRRPANATREDLALDYSEAGMGLLALLGKRQMSFTTVLTGFLRGAFLKYSALTTESWHAIGSAIRDAQEIGLHRDNPDVQPVWPPGAGKSTAASAATSDATSPAACARAWELERRRRLWMSLVMWDVQMAVTLGRPTTVDLNVRLTLPVDYVPLPPDDPAGDTTPVRVRGPDDPPTPLTRTLWVYQTMDPLRAMIALERDGLPHPGDYSPVDALHAQLAALDERIPPYFRPQNPDTRFDDRPGCAWLRPTRLTIRHITLVDYMALHRPYIFMRAESRTEALRACLAMLEVQRAHFATLRPHQYKTFSVFFGTFDSIVLLSAIYLFFPQEHPEQLPDAIRHFRLSVTRFQRMAPHYSLTRSALGVLRALYLRLRKVLGIRFLEGEGECEGDADADAANGTDNDPGHRIDAVDALTLSNIDPSLKGEGPVGPTAPANNNNSSSSSNPTDAGTTADQHNPGNTGAQGLTTPGAASCHSVPSSSTGSDVFSASAARNDTPTTEVAETAGTVGSSGSGGGDGDYSGGLPLSGGLGGSLELTQTDTIHMDTPHDAAATAAYTGDVLPNVPPDLLDPQLVSPVPPPLPPMSDTVLFPDGFDWSSLPPVYPTGDMTYNILLGAGDGTAAVWDGGGGGGGGGPGATGPLTVGADTAATLGTAEMTQATTQVTGAGGMDPFSAAMVPCGAGTMDGTAAAAAAAILPTTACGVC
ncbi:Transcription factor [Niveomyces insectorum RCEF 264]|uniref:Transcription factor n=1 Tax=Niveomyces insectorum RCEF 264 TaxID=1081102 RepID=A0A167ZA88_9HYPO|nr:Transcription factor [Niveomyces insectorum RCEF 264]